MLIRFFLFRHERRSSVVLDAKSLIERTLFENTDTSKVTYEEHPSRF